MVQPQQPQVQLEVPDGLVPGVYSNLVGVWHTPHEFTLDFAVMQPPQQAQTEGGEPLVLVPARVVARIKIPPALMFQLMQALSTNEKLYEEGIGPIPKPGKASDEPPLFPPAE